MAQLPLSNTGIAEVSFSIVNSSANITVLPEGILVFQDGQTEAQITVYVFDDEIPEESEIVTIHLDSTTGELRKIGSVVHYNTMV